MIEEDALADPRGRMDVRAEDRRRPALQIKREILAAALPQAMREAMRLDRVEALEIKQRLDKARAGGIAVEDGHQIGAERLRQWTGRAR